MLSYCENKIADIKANCDLAIEGRDVKIMELEKENAELKARIDNLKDEIEYSENYGKRVQKERHRVVNDNAELRDQLTKAKEHIKQLLGCLKQDTNDPQTNYYVCKYMDEAEQFLKGEQQDKWVNPITTTNDPFVR